MSPRLLPTLPDKRSITAQLNQAIQTAEALYAAVCFWAIGPEVLDSRLVYLLGQPGSFCIVDIHPPTNVDRLDDFYQLGGTNFRVFAKEIQLKTGEYFLQRHLLHMKMLVFDLPGQQAEIWVGSHNFTKQALRGTNREATLVIPCIQGDAMYQQARAYLASVLADPDCRPFDPAVLDDYKKLQRIPEEEAEGGSYVLPLAWDSSRMATLAQQTVTLAGNNAREGRELFQASGAVRPLAIRAYDLASNSIRHFAAIVQNQGTIDADVASSYDLAFGPRHLAVRPAGIMPYVAPRETPLTRADLLKFSFWATVRILDELPADLVWEPVQRASTAEWVYDPATTQELYQDEVAPSAYGVGVEEAPRSYATFAFEDTSVAAVEVRVRHWLDWATHRKARRVPGPPDGQRAVFSAERIRNDEPTELDKLDESFRPANRSRLLLGYEAPIRRQYYEQANSSENFAADRMPRLTKLVKRYRLVL